MRRAFLYTLIAVNLVALPSLFFLSKKASELPPGASAPAVVGQAADFALTDQRGQNVSRKDFMGKVWVANFMFTSCPNICPAMSTKMSALQSALPAAIALVSFSVNPETDTPAVLAGYAERYRAQEGRWFFLTGEKARIDEVLQSFYLNKAGDPNLHSTRWALVDSAGGIRGYYDSTEAADIRRLETDARALAAKGGI